MNSERVARAKEVFLAARELPSSARLRFISEQCAGDDDLRHMVERLLVVDISETSEETSNETPSSLPDHIGPYRILGRIGEGGMGTVYLGEQVHPMRRKVAVKVLKTGMDSRAILARFEAERQALALMDHDNIAKVLDAGQTETGSPYFTMEWIQGEPITKFCDRKSLSNRDRLELFILVCQAVQHAHQKGVIHRDLKPSNILVIEKDGVGVPKVIDFGIAKALAGPLTEKTLHTQFGQFLGTPEYMSPEQTQAGQIDVDTRADVYALGVVLYEMLTGALPFSSETLRRASMEEVLRIIREQEPAKPSTKVSTLGPVANDVARLRRTEARKLIKDLRHDLDWVILKALEKDRARRYETATALASEIRRFLADEPVLAGPPNPGYRLRKLLRRHRVGVAIVSTLVIATLIAGAAVTFALFESNRQRAAAIRAQRELEGALKEAELGRDFLTEMLRDVLVNVEEGEMWVMRVKDVLAEVEQMKGGNAYDRMGVTLDALAHLYAVRGDQEKCLDAGRHAIEAFAKGSGLRSPQAIGARSTFTEQCSAAGRWAEAESCGSGALRDAHEVLGREDGITQHLHFVYARVLINLGRGHEADSLCGTLYDIRAETLGEAHWLTQAAKVLQSQARLLDGRPREANTLVTQAIETFRTTTRPPPLSMLEGETHAIHGRCLLSLQDLAGAELAFLEAERIHRRDTGVEGELWSPVVQDLVSLYRQMGKSDLAERWERKLAAASAQAAGSE
jgi:serine/threonine protein kinase